MRVSAPKTGPAAACTGHAWSVFVSLSRARSPSLGVCYQAALPRDHLAVITTDPRKRYRRAPGGAERRRADERVSTTPPLSMRAPSHSTTGQAW